MHSYLILLGAFLLITTNTYSYHIGLCVMATGKYDQFANEMIQSARTHFCKNHRVTFFVFSDGNINPAPDTIIMHQKRLGWPHDTLMRNPIYHEHRLLFKTCDYLFAIDADMRFVDTVGDEILGERVATRHPGFRYKRGSYETRSQSTACVKSYEGKYYFAGGFFGGSRQEFCKLISITTEEITKDLAQNIIAVWHDESHLNRYFIDHPPTVILSPSYCYPENCVLPYEKKLIALEKNHKEMRSMNGTSHVAKKSVMASQHLKKLALFKKQGMAILDQKEGYTKTPPAKKKSPATEHMVPQKTITDIDQIKKPLRELPIFVVIPSYNNEKWCAKNLISVLSQNYSNYTVLYIDDHSTDSTAKLVGEIIATHPQGHHVELIINSKRHGALDNIYRAIQSCEDSSIVVLLDGDDWLLGDQVFSLLSEIYQTKNVWITHGTFGHYPKLQDTSWSTPIPEHIVKQNAFRTYRCPSHLRTFYAWLFKKINLKDLLDNNGNFFTMTWDQAMLFPMFEMAGERHYFVPDVVYAYNVTNPINDNKVNPQLQRDLEVKMRSQKRYKRLDTLTSIPAYQA